MIRAGLGSTSVSGASAAAIGLGALAANGSAGPQTQAIGTSSDAYQLVPVSSGLCLATDERGLARPGAGTTDCDAGAYGLQHQPVTLAQAGTTTAAVTTGTAFTGQLAVTGATGPVSYLTTSPASPVTVSAAGVITRPATVPPGLPAHRHRLRSVRGQRQLGVHADRHLAGPARADLSISASAPAEVAPSAAVTVTVKVANAGPSAAVKAGTALLIPPGRAVASAGGGTVIGR